MNKQRRNIYKFPLFLLLVFIAASGQKMHAQEDEFKHSIVNWGFRVGMNALSTNHYSMFVGEDLLANSSNENNIGYGLAGYTRINLGNIFMQPELSCNLYKQSFSFALQDEDATIALLRNITANSYVGTAAVLAGYNIVKEGPYLLSFIAGPSIKYTYKTKYTSKSEANFTDRTVRYNYTGIVGFSVSVSRIHFDIRYEFNMPHSNVNFGDVSNASGLFKDIFIKKNENILGFSCGVMF